MAAISVVLIITSVEIWLWLLDYSSKRLEPLLYLKGIGRTTWGQVCTLNDFLAALGDKSDKFDCRDREKPHGRECIRTRMPSHGCQDIFTAQVVMYSFCLKDEFEAWHGPTSLNHNKHHLLAATFVLDCPFLSSALLLGDDAAKLSKF